MNHPARILGIYLCAMLMATSAFATPPARAADNTLTLYLQPGLHGPGFTAPFTPAPDIPPGAIVITVPLYPAAVPTAERESIPTLGYSPTPYLKSDGAAYLLPTDPATALAWYRQAFVAAGYAVSASGASRDAHTGASSLSITFAAMSMAAVNLTVQLSLEADAQGQTIVYYEAEAITVPARDPRSVLPDTVARVDVTYHLPLGTEPPTIQTTLTRPADVAALVVSFNALPRDGRGPHGCLVGTGEGAILVFVKGTGSTLTATIDPACSSVAVVGYPPLLDEGGRLWTTIKRNLASTLSPAGMPISTSGRGKRQGECVPLIRVPGTISTCYLPGHQKEAQERLAPRPVNPVPAVARVYHHFPLRQVIVLSGMRAGLRGSPVSIVYVYGIPNNRLCPPGYHCPLIPTYLLVRETVGHLVGRGLRITRARQLDPATGRMADGPVELQANIPRRTLVLHITANMWQQDVLRIAQGILQAATDASARQAHGSYLPAHVTRVRIAYWLPLVPHGEIATQRTIRLTITRQSDIAALVRVVDALPLSPRMPGSPPPTCDVSTGQHVTLVFVPYRGRPVVVTNDPACGTVTITGVPLLSDPNLRFWMTARAIVNRRCHCVPSALT